MRVSLFIPAAAVVLVSAVYASSVGSGAPNPTAAAGFLNAYLRGGFQLATTPPTSDVIAFGSPGLIQLFSASANKNLTYALVKADQDAPVSSTDTLQVFADIYSVYNGIGVGNAGYPSMDTTSCGSNPVGTCNYQLFTKNYAIFAYSVPPSQNFVVKDPIFSEWMNQGGLSGTLGTAASVDKSVTSSTKIVGTQQNFANGAVFSYSTSSAAGAITNTLTVSGTTYIAYGSGGGFAQLGFPLAEEIVLASGVHRQLFENARIEWSATAPPQIFFPLSEVDIQNAAAGLLMLVGDVITLSATTFDSNGKQVTGRTLTWTTSNGQAVTIQGNGYTATVKAIAQGAANVTVTGEGITSPAIQIRVGGTCCAVGQGAPTATIQQAFQDAVTRNHLMLSLPNATAVVRTIGGYQQTFLASAPPAISAIVAQSDKSNLAYVLAGSLYSAFLLNGGFAGVLGFPSSDPSPGGTQTFESGWALGGAPVHAVPPQIANKWAALGYETKAFGVPTSDAAAYQSTLNSTGTFQVFAGGNIYAATSGAAFASSGLILARYLVLAGPGGILGAPTSDIVSTGGVSRQNFEGGYVDLQTGAAAAVEHLNPRNPSITATPSRLAPGGKVHVAISGFAPNAMLSVGITGQATFQVSVPVGRYSWDIVVPANSLGTVTIQVKDAAGTDSASASYSVVGLPQLAPSFTAISGDGQTGAPGSLLPLPLMAILKDINGNPLSGIPVFASASSGVSVQVSPVTDTNGVAMATVRLPAGGLALVSLTSGGKVVSFSAQTAGFSISGFPVLSQQDSNTLIGNGSQTLLSKGSLVTTLAGVIRYYQNLGQLGSPNGLATPQLLNQYLAGNGGYTISETGDLIASPWSAIAFTGTRGGVVVEAISNNRLLDLIGSGTPVLIGIAIQVDGAPGGMTFAVATGIGDDGSIQLADPAFGNTSFNAYLRGFASGSHAVTGALAAMVDVNPTKTMPQGFAISAPVRAGVTATSVTGNCGPVVQFLDIAVPGQPAPGTTGGVGFVACDGSQAAYQVSFAAPLTAVALDFVSASVQSIPTNTARVFSVMRGSNGLTFSPQKVGVAAVVNSASFTAAVTAGGLATIYGAGFVSAATETPTVSVGGQNAYVYSAFPFQVNFQMPPGLAPGSTTLTVSGSLGAASRVLTISVSAPAIFSIGTAAGGQMFGAVQNQNGSLNGGTNPANRGEYLSIYCTGLGAKVSSGGYQVTVAPVKVVLAGFEVAATYAGVSPGLIGVDQVNVLIPTSLPPSLSTQMSLRQSGSDSNSVIVAIQ